MTVAYIAIGSHMTTDNQAQIIDDKIKHDAICEDARVAGEDLALTGIFNIALQRKHPHLPRFRHQPIQQRQEIHIHRFGVFGRGYEAGWYTVAQKPRCQKTAADDRRMAEYNRG